MKIKDLGKVGIILDGGAFIGIHQPGPIKAILERGIKPGYLQGVSVGALNAAKYVETGSIHEVEKIWYYVEEKGPGILFNHKNPPIHILKGASSLYSDAGLDHLLDHIKHPGKITQSNIQLDIIAHNRSNNNKYTVFSNTDRRFRDKPELVVKAVKASASIPMIFPPVELWGDYYSDGLYFSIEWAINAGCNTIFVISTRHSHHGFDPISNHWLKQFMMPFNTVLDRYNALAIDRYKHHSSLNLPFRVIEVMIKDRSEAISSSSFPRGGKEFRRAVRLSYEQTNKILDKLKIK